MLDKRLTIHHGYVNVFMMFALQVGGFHMSEILRSRFVGMHELRKNLTKLLVALHEEGHEVVITRQGKPTAVIVDMDKYLEVQEALKEFSDPEYVANLLEAKRDIRHGRGVPAEEVFQEKGL